MIVFAEQNVSACTKRLNKYLIKLPSIAQRVINKQLTEFRNVGLSEKFVRLSLPSAHAQSYPQI